MAIAGRVAIVPKGDWSADATYKRLDAVTYNNTLYFAKKEVPAGTATSNTEYWSKSIVGGASAIATTEDAGVVKPDGKSMSVDESGTLSINLDGTTITLDEAKNVIKLADTLKDKINGAFPAANLINNLTTTEAGFGLDARQGKVLDDKITEINGSLKGVINTKNFEVTDKTILEYILSTHSFIGSQTFTATCADKPPNNAEYNIFWFGSNMRITVLALEYSFNNTSKLYRREIFGNEWLAGWIEL